MNSLGNPGTASPREDRVFRVVVVDQSKPNLDG